MRLQPGQSIGRYHILEQLGKGGMATVYKAYDTRLERNVAIKVIRVEAFDPDMLQNVLQRFEREGKMLARLSHPNIVNVFDFGEFEGSPYLVMEYIPGGTLKEGSRAAMPWPQAVQMLLPVARALAHAHSLGIVHRDIKPSNILLAQSGEPMLTDFGIAKILEGEQGATLTGTGVGVGTPEYMAPEQGMGKPVDARTDIYALGVVLYELVTGQRPYQADTPMAVVIKHITEPLPRPRQVNAQLPDAVERVIIKALAKEPDERYPDMTAFIAALEGLAASAATQAGQTMQVGLETEIQPRQPGNFPTAGGFQATGRPATGPGLQTTSTGTSTLTGPQAQAGGAKKTSYLPLLLILGAAGVLIVCAVIAIFAWSRLRPGQVASVTNTLAAQATSGSVATEPASAAATAQPTEPAQVFPTARPTEAPTQATIPTIPPTSTEQVVQAPTITPSSGSVRVSTMDGAEMVYVPEGTFWRGIDESMLPDLQAICDSCKPQMFEDELPMQQVFVSAMWMYKTEITNQQYAACVQAGACKPPSDFSSATRTSYYGNPEFANYPVVYVTWQQAYNYCAWAGGRLPTEAEWEKAARGVDKRYFPWGNDFQRGVYNNADAVNQDTTEVGSYPAGASPYGALDMSGNVYEWLADWYSGEAYDSPITSNPTGPTSGENRVIRSGAFGFREGFSLAVFRDWETPESTSRNVGFRCMQAP